MTLAILVRLLVPWSCQYPAREKLQDSCRLLSEDSFAALSTVHSEVDHLHRRVDLLS